MNENPTMDMDSYLAHIGVLRRSGRYPWGSGGNVDAAREFQGLVGELHKQGMTPAQIAEALSTEDHKVTQSELRRAKTITKNEIKAADAAMAFRLQEKGMSNGAIAERLGLAGESSVRALLAAHNAGKLDVLSSTANMLRDQVEQKEIVDIGVGVERHLGISRDKLKTAVHMLEDEGYKKQYVKVPQLGTSFETTVTVLTPPGMSYSELYSRRDDIRQIREYSNDGGKSWTKIKPPLSIDSKRVKVRYGDEGGDKEDGLIYIKPGVEDLSMGGNRYSQARIAVDGTHYLKGMAIIKEDYDWPPGVDVVFNTPKKNTGNKLDAMKELEWDKDPDNPFGSAISRQITKFNKAGDEVASSAVNMVYEAGAWDDWNRNLPTQMLAKQKPALIQKQVDKVYEKSKQDLDEIMALTNPVVKKKLLEEYAENADTAAVTLKAASIKGQSTHVIMPVPSMKDTEVYAPNFTNGTRVALVRFPHAGLFEIPELTVNNNHPKAKKLLGDAQDAIGINAKVAEQLSGADFDGDAVLVIPNNNRAIKSRPPLEGLLEFNPRESYPSFEGMKPMDAREKGLQMGKVSNLITDMTLKGANDQELTWAAKHAMVVIDAQKHKLNWKQSELDNHIPTLMKRYQGTKQGAASTLMSRAQATKKVPERKQGYKIDPKTGKKIYSLTEREPWYDKDGKKHVPYTNSKKLAETDDAYTLTSGGSKRNPGTLQEDIYAAHSNRMKSLANEARKESVRIKAPPANASAKKAYAGEVASLNEKLDRALRNAPLERQAQVVGNAIYREKLRANPNMEDDDRKKYKHLALEEGRHRVGAGKETIKITPEEWAAVQAGAISPSKLRQILNNADPEEIKKYATPKASTSIPPAKLQRAQAMLSNGASYAEISDALGVPLSTLKDNLFSG